RGFRDELMETQRKYGSVQAYVKHLMSQAAPIAEKYQHLKPIQSGITEHTDHEPARLQAPRPYNRPFKVFIQCARIHLYTRALSISAHRSEPHDRAEAAERSWRRLDGRRQSLKLISM